MDVLKWNHGGPSGCLTTVAYRDLCVDPPTEALQWDPGGQSTNVPNPDTDNGTAIPELLHLLFHDPGKAFTDPNWDPGDLTDNDCEWDPAGVTLHLLLPPLFDPDVGLIGVLLQRGFWWLRLGVG